MLSPFLFIVALGQVRLSRAPYGLLPKPATWLSKLFAVHISSSRFLQHLLWAMSTATTLLLLIIVYHIRLLLNAHVDEIDSIGSRRWDVWPWWWMAYWLIVVLQQERMTQVTVGSLCIVLFDICFGSVWTIGHRIWWEYANTRNRHLFSVHGKNNGRIIDVQLLRPIYLFWS